MFLKLTLFELRKALIKRANLIYFTVFFVMAFFLVHAATGFFNFIKIILVGESMHLNGAYIINRFLGYFKVFLIFVVSSTVASVVFNDYKYNTLSMTFTTGVSKINFIFSKFIASCLTTTFVMSGAVLGHIIACLMPYLDASYFNELNLIYYLVPFAQNYLLNIAIVTAIFMAFTVLFRSSLVNWVLVILFYGVHIIATFYFDDIDTSITGALIDPTGSLAEKLQVHGMSAEQLNQYTLNFKGVYLWNRLLWVGMGLISIIILLIKFDFQYQTSFFNFRKKPRGSNKPSIAAEQLVLDLAEIRHPKLPHIRSSLLSIWFRCYLSELKFITFSIHFILTIIIGFVMLTMTSSTTGHMYETGSYPVTFLMVELITSTFNILLTLFIALMAGELIWRERSTGSSEINDVLPISSLIPASSKIVALISTVIIFLSFFIVAGMIVQTSKGFYDFQIWQYITSIFGFELIDYVLFTIFAFFVHSLVNSKYVSLLILLIYYFLGVFGVHIFEHGLLQFNNAPSVIYSDLNGYGNNVYSFWVFKIYWILFSFVLLLVTKLFWIRGESLMFKKRFNQAWNNKSEIKSPLFLTLVFLFFVGSYIFYNTNILNTYKTSHKEELQKVSYENKYKQYEHIISPEITKINVNIDIFPEKTSASGQVKLQLTNTSNQAINTIHLGYSKQVTKNIKFSNVAELTQSDDELDYYIYTLSEPLAMNQNMELSFDFELKDGGFTIQGASTSINNNGTFINSNMFFPSFGYNASYEMMSNRTRSKYDLAERPLALKRDDPIGLKSSLFGPNNHFTNMDITMSTIDSQTAFSAGNLYKQWQANGRNYFHYKNKAKVQNFIPFVSGDYSLRTDTWQDANKEFDPVEISVHYYKSHDYNIDNIMQSAKASLDYYSNHFSPYAQDQLRIIEFPRTYGSYAQSFPGTVPFSETIGFLTDLRGIDKEDVPFSERKIDIAFFVSAHEIAHQWWAHQVSSANVEGVNFLIESLSEYSALKVMEQKYGKQNLKKFLRTERQKYLLSRGSETYEERPLARTLRTQQAILYNKGSLSLYALDNYLGSDIFDKAIKALIEKFAFQSNPYPTSKDFIDYLLQFSPENLHYFIDDHLNKITLYKAEINTATYERDENLNYQADISLEINKFYSDENGKETITQMNDIIEIGIYNSKDKELHLEKVKLVHGENKLSFKLKRKPKYIVIDPYYHIITKDFIEVRKDFSKYQNE